MQRHLSNIVWSIAKACGLLAGLAACAPPPAYFAERLDRVPSPTPALMAKTAAPDCKVAAAPASASVSGTSKSVTATERTVSDFESEADAPDAAASPRKVQTVAQDSDQNSALKRLARERDCYKRAEQVARQRLEALQASSAQTMVALDRIRDDVPGPGEPTAW